MPTLYQKLRQQTAERREKAAQLWAAGMRQIDIAKKLKISRQRVHQLLRR